jgi:hypothetical protein
VFENRVLRRIFKLKGDEVIEGLTKLHEELINLYCLPSIITMMKSRKIIWADHVAQMGNNRNTYMIQWKSQKERDR